MRHDRDGQACLLRRLSSAAHHGLRIRLVHRRSDDHQAPAVAPQQAAHADDAEGGIVEIEPGVLIGPDAAPVGSKGKLAVQQVAHARVLRLDLVEDHRIRRSGFHDVADRLHRVLVREIGRDVQMERRAPQPARDRGDELGRVVHHVVFGGHDKADDIRPPGPQAHAGTVRDIADFVRDGAHAGAGVEADVLCPRQGARHRRNRQPGQARDGLQRRLACLVPCRLIHSPLHPVVRGCHLDGRPQDHSIFFNRRKKQSCLRKQLRSSVPITI